MKKFVNALSVFRIIASFVIIPLLMFQWYWVAFILFALAGFSDLFDGILARKYNVTSKIGGVLDHLGDKFLFAVPAICMVAFLQLWLIAIPIILMICRNLYISGLREFMGTQKIEMPVPKPRMSWGKIAATLQMVFIGGLLLWLCLIESGVTHMLIVRDMLWLCIGGLWLATIASLTAAWQYTKDFIAKYKQIK